MMANGPSGIRQAPTGDGQGDEAMRLKHLALGAALIALAVGVTACGKRGPLEPPPGSAAAEKAKKAKKAKRAKKKDAKVIEERTNKVEKPHEPFILDILL
jgi:predicted small lipoprotein YifL